MRKLPFIFAAICLVFFSCKRDDAIKPNPPAGSYVFGGEGRETCNGLMELPDGNILMVGAAQQPENEDYDVQLICVRPDGSEVWTRDYRIEGTNDTGYRIIPASYGYAVACFVRASAQSLPRLAILKLDPDFERIDLEMLEFGSSDNVVSAINAFFTTPNGNHVIGYSSNATSTILVMDADLDFVAINQLSQYYASQKREFLQPYKDGMLTGQIRPSADYSEVELVISFYDQDGQGQWAIPVTLDQLSFDSQIGAITPLSDGTIAVTVAFAYGGSQLHRLDSAANVLSNTDLDENALISMIRELPSGNLALAGNNFDEYYYGGSTPNNITFMEVDANNAVLWSRSYGGPNEELARDLLISTTGARYIGGHTQSFGQGESDSYLVIHQ